MKLLAIIWKCCNKNWETRHLLWFYAEKLLALSFFFRWALCLYVGNWNEPEIKQNDTKTEQLIRKNYFRIIFFPLAFTANIVISFAPCQARAIDRKEAAKKSSIECYIIMCILQRRIYSFINIRITVLRQYTHTHFIRFDTLLVFFNFTKIQLTRYKCLLCMFML